jgi:FtsH-binding integral membrane protein
VEDKKTTTAAGTQDMINIFENNNARNNSTSADFLHSRSDITFILSLIPLVIFVWLAVRSKSIKAFQFQISTFIAVYILGEIIESNRIAIFSVLPPDIGPQIHVGSAIFFTIMVWFRFYYAEKRGKKMIESSIENDNSSRSSSGSSRSSSSSNN